MRDARIHNLEFYKGKRVLVTGHTGFKVAWLTAVLRYMQANTLGYALLPEKNSLYERMNGNELISNVTGDLLDISLLDKTIQEFRPEIIIHLAAFGFIKECYCEPTKAYQTNVIGSMNLLECVRKCDSVRSVIIVSTDKVYENKGDGAIYSENDSLGGLDPYSSSKSCMELLVRCYASSYLQVENKKIGIATVRASNVLAGGDHVQTRLIPSILQALDNGSKVELRNPIQTRPWQSVLDALNGYLTIARYLYVNPLKYSGAWNIGPDKDGIKSVSWVFEKMRNAFEGLNVEQGEKLAVSESETLGLDIHRALTLLDWQPIFSCDRVVELVVEFYKRQKRGESEYKICMSQIEEFFNTIKK